MKRKITLVAKGDSTNAKVTIEVNTPPHYGRADTTRLTLDLADEITSALGKKYRPSRITLR